MKVSSISVYDYNHSRKFVTQKKQNRVTMTQQNQPSFKECNFFKVAGFIAGTAACCVIAPGLAAMGLAGLGALPGALVGSAIDDKINGNND